MTVRLFGNTTVKRIQQTKFVFCPNSRVRITIATLVRKITLYLTAVTNVAVSFKVAPDMTVLASVQNAVMLTEAVWADTAILGYTRVRVY